MHSHLQWTSVFLTLHPSHIEQSFAFLTMDILSSVCWNPEVVLTWLSIMKMDILLVLLSQLSFLFWEFSFWICITVLIELFFHIMTFVGSVYILGIIPVLNKQFVKIIFYFLAFFFEWACCPLQKKVFHLCWLLFLLPVITESIFLCQWVQDYSPCYHLSNSVYMTLCDAAWESSS